MEQHPKNLTTDLEIDEAIEQAKEFDHYPRIVEAIYRPEPELDLFMLKLDDGRRLILPRENLSELKGATPDQVADFTIGRHGRHLWWPQVDDGIYLPNLLDERYGGARGSVAA